MSLSRWTAAAHRTIIFFGVIAATLGVACPAVASGQELKPAAFNFPPRDFACASDVIASGDFNNDGHPDLICLIFPYSILLGDGHGGFGPAISFPLTLQVNPRQVALADLNGDGNLDVIVLSQGNPLLFIFLGNGDGTFQPPLETYQFTYNPGPMVTGDINGDGKLDIVVMETNAALAAIFLGNGDGTFRDGGTVQLSDGPESPALVDMNGDGALDLVVSASNNIQAGVMVVALGNGDGTFKPSTVSALLGDPGPVLVGDFNGDGKPDVIVYSRVSELLFGNGDGTFRKPVSILPGLSASGLLVADFNHDGKLDLAAQLVNQNKVEIFLGDGRGDFSELASFPIANSTNGFCPQGLLAGYFNDDSNLDLVVGGPQSRVVSLLLGKGNGTFVLPPHFDDPHLLNAVSGDLNGDGRLDLVSVNYEGAIGVLLGNGDATFQKANYFPAGKELREVRLGDFTGDGRMDAIFVSDAGYLGVLPGKGDGTFGPAIFTAVGNARYAETVVVVGDFNGDGMLDAAINAPPKIFLGNGDGTFRQPIPYVLSQAYVALAVADLNGDGKLDLVALESTDGLEAFSQLIVLLGKGDGTFETPVYIAVDTYANSLSIADLNGDRIPDIAVSTAGTVDVMFGNGDGSFRPYASYYPLIGASEIAIADFNLDGWPDLVLTGGFESSAFLMMNRGDGTFRLGSKFLGIAPDSGTPLAMDFNGDGKPDLAIASPNVIFVYTNTTASR